MIPYVPSHTKDKDVQNLNDSVQRVFNSIISHPLLQNPVLVKDLKFTNGVDLLVNHKLNRKVIGYFVTRSNTPVLIYDSPSTNTISTVRICLRSNADATVDILFF